MGNLIKIYGKLKGNQPSLEEFKQFLELLDTQTILDTPNRLYWRNDTKFVLISKFSDRKVVQRYSDGMLSLHKGQEKNSLLFILKNDIHNDLEFVLSILDFPESNIFQLNTLVKYLLAFKPLYYLKCKKQYASKILLRQHFKYENIDLGWYNYFSLKYLQNLKEMGRNIDLIYTNPFSTVTRTEQGIIEQTGDSPLEILTEEGKLRFIQSGNYLLGK